MNLKQNDNEIYQIINNESKRQAEVIELIASENYVSRSVMEAQGSCLTNKYAEGYPSKRYYGGCVEVDKAENLALERVKKLFNCSYANVQPHSGSQANQAVFLALLDPMDTILTMDLNSGGHLTHGSPVNLSGKWFKPVHYGVDKTTFRINYDEVEELALKHRPKLIIAGYSCYSRQIDFARFREIADKVGAYLMGDIAHFAGIIAAGEHPPLWPHVHVATSTTHKTLRGPRGGIILSNDDELGKKFNQALFPGIQGGPLMHVIAAKAVAFKEALTPEYKTYIKQLLGNAKVLGETLIENGYDILTGGTENHMVTIDLRNKGINGKDACNALVRAGLNCNKNSIPFDTASPFITSGVRLGTAACTTRGFKEEEFILVGKLVAIVLDGLANNPEDNSEIEQAVLSDVKELMKKFPIYERENGKILINDSAIIS